MKLLLRARIWCLSKSLDIRMGGCSGFPPCCIFWFLTWWRLLLGDLTKTPAPYEKVAWRSRAVMWYHARAGNAGYVPCPLCLISGARVRVRRCTDDCGHYRECNELAKLRRRLHGEEPPWTREYFD